MAGTTGLEPAASAVTVNAKAGSVQHMDAFTHLLENKSKKPFAVIQVELKVSVRAKQSKHMVDRLNPQPTDFAT
jgi:hypothetical protein